MNPLQKLSDEGQSIWLDFIRRSLITSGELNRLIEEDGLRGMTSNPTIFEKAIAGSVDYDDSLRRALEKNPHLDDESLFEVLAIEDIQSATDVLRPLYDATQGADGYVSLEVSPALANDTDNTIAEARRLWKCVDRPNVMIKVPATREGVPAFERLTADGINVNVTLMFSLEDYEAVAQAYIRGLKLCERPEQIASVASFFVSRVDGVVDKALEADGSPAALALRGKIAVANAKLAYKRFQEIFYGDTFEPLRQKGARVQRPLWASTSTKNPEYNDVLYVEELIGPDTVNTLPPATLAAFRDHGVVRETITAGVEEATARIDALAQHGVDLAAITEKLQVDGVASFAKSFRDLLEALKKKRSTILLSRSDRQYLNLGPAEAAVAARLDQWGGCDYSGRLWRKDPTLWSQTSEPELENRLGWLDLPKEMHEQMGALESFRKDVHKRSFSHAVLLGMGGSSLAPEVYHRTFGHRKGYPELIVLDSTHPQAVREVEERIDIEHTLFFVSSKSGTTTETLSFFYYFWEKAKANGHPGGQFVAITDSGTPLESLARERGFRQVFQAPGEVGGRYSALSVFGLVPAAAIGLNVHQVLDGAWAMADNAAANIPVEKNPALALGAALGELAISGRNKLTVIASPGIAALPTWIEQLIAESTGKNDKGILPVIDEALGSPEVYGNDRFFVHVSTVAETHHHEEPLSKLEFAEHPVARIQIHDRTLIGQEFFRWEVAVAAAGSALGIHPFNQPDVQMAKDLARQAMADKRGAGSGWEDGVTTVRLDETGAAQQALAGWLRDAKSGDYVALQAFIAPSAETTVVLQGFRHALRDGTRLATTLGYGPRFLHSTGQFHKGGPNTGWFIQIVDDVVGDVPVPDTDYTFGELIRAQALGDAEALLQRGRRVLRLIVNREVLSRLVEIVPADRG